MLRLEFEVMAVDVDETYAIGEDPVAFVERLARAKAAAGAAQRPDALVLGSDTVVVQGDDVLGKPRDGAEAVEMLARLQGKEHRVETGVAIMAPGGRVASAVEGVRVRFRPFDLRTAREYVATDEPMDKAGAYGIQGFGAALVERIDGDFFAVMGLPVARTIELFAALGWRYDFEGLTAL